MKKFLAIFLALMMIMTVALVSCKKNDNTDEDGDNWDNEGYDSIGSGSESGSGSGSGSESGSDSGTGAGTWIPKEDSVYVGMNSTALRDGPGSSYGKVATVNSGTALTRKETNGTWDKVVYNDKECYVLHALVASDANDFQFDDLAVENRVNLTIAQGKQVNLRTTPFVADVPSDDKAFTFNVGVSGLGSTANPHDAATNPLVKIGVSKSGNWYKVEYKGNTYYIAKNTVTSGTVVDPSAPAGSGNGGGDIG